jgi:thymidine kinase
MNAGKSTHLLQVNHNYKERGMKTVLITSGIDDRYGVGKIASRIGLSAEALSFHADTNMFDLIPSGVSCVIVDECQFLTRKQVEQLADYVDEAGVPVMCYGLRVDFKQGLFEGSAALFALADKCVEMKTICHCGSKATQIAKVDESGRMVDFNSPQVEIGGNDRYISMCRRHYNELKDF